MHWSRSEANMPCKEQCALVFQAPIKVGSLAHNKLNSIAKRD